MEENFRKTPPAPTAPVEFSIPQPFKSTLDNGLRVIIFEDHRLPLVSYRLALNVGDINDPDQNVGLISAVASMLTEGTAELTSLQLAERIERLGASLSAHASDDFTIISASALSLYGSEVLRLLSEVVLRPTFPENELDLYRRNTIEHLTFQRSQPGFLAGEQTARLVYGAHPYSRVAPSADGVAKLDREALMAQHARTFLPNAATLIIIGDVDRSALETEINELFGGWQKADPLSSEFPDPPQPISRTLCLVDRPGSAQSNIVITNLAVKRNHPDYFPLIVMNQVLGAGASSRVFMNLREEKGYTYGAYTRLNSKKLTGDLEATAEVRTAVTGDSLKEFFFELERIREEKVTEQELSDAKSFLTGVFPLRAETQEGLTNLIVNQHLYGLPDDYLQTYRANVDAVTSDEVMRVARKFVRPDTAAIVIVGDVSEVLPQVRDYAEMLEIFDTSKKRLDPSDFSPAEDASNADAAGNWSLNIDFQGQQLPVTLSLLQDGASLSGTLETMLGNGRISDGKISGTRLSATAKAEMRGEKIEFAISGQIEGESMVGTIAAPIVPEPLTFTGSRNR